jgi:hypothetical protein
MNALATIVTECLLLQELIFESFNIESKHEANEILMEINLENLVQALRSAQSSDAVTVKLTKKHGTPFLTLDIEQVYRAPVHIKAVYVCAIGSIGLVSARSPQYGLQTC